MDCKAYNKNIKRFIHDELDGRELEQFLIHLNGCKDCYEELEILYIIEKSIVDVDESENISYDFNSRLKEFIAINEEKVYLHIKMEFMHKLTYAVSTVIAVAAALFFFL